MLIEGKELISNHVESKCKSQDEKCFLREYITFLKQPWPPSVLMKKLCADLKATSMVGTGDLGENLKK